MYNIISIIVFSISLILYVHVSYYHRETDERDIIVLDEKVNLNTIELFNKTIEDIGRSRLPCIFTNTTIFNNVEEQLKDEMTYLNLLMELNQLKLYVPFSYNDTNDKNDKKQLHRVNTDIYLSIEACEFMENDVCVNKEPMRFDINKFNNKDNIMENQLTVINRLRKIVELYTIKYLFNQYITRRDYIIYFSNYENATYIKMQYFKNPLNVFCVLDGECDVIIAHPSYKDNKNVSMEEDYVFFRFYDRAFQFDNGYEYGVETYNPLIINHHQCVKGDVIVLPAYWFISIKIKPQCVLSHESVTTATSTISLAPDYVKHLFYRSTIKTVSNVVSEVKEASID